MDESNDDSVLWLFPVELVLFALIFAGDVAGWLPLSKTPFLVAVAWGSLWLRGQNWRSVGFALPPMWLGWFAIGVGTGIGFWMFEYFVENPLLFWLTGESVNMGGLDDLENNKRLLAVLLLFNLVLVAIGEELVWRGYALSRVAEIMRGTRWNWIAAFCFVNAAFGIGLLIQGAQGLVLTFVHGIFLGLLYFAAGRNLLAPMAAHFTVSSIDFVLIYLGQHPGPIV